ncbi:BatA domain-containing protein [Lacunimicrobium album]
MSFLYGAFLLGGLAIAAPIIFHMIRRTPQSHYEFSSLMFLQPSPPRMTKRSHIDQWLLLLLRSLAILLLAVAFMRPYLRAQADLSLDDAPQRHIAILLDRSASMKRGDLWDKAIAQAKSVIHDLGPTDEVSLFAFDERLETIIAPENTEGLDRDQRRELARNAMDDIKPTWAASDLGTAMLGVAERIEAVDDMRQTHATLQIVLISDLQSGSKLEALQTTEWPKTVRLDVKTVVPEKDNNARVRLVETPIDEAEETPSPRVRVRNTSGSTTEQFHVVWSNGIQDCSRPVAFYVPPGESLVLPVPYDVNGQKPDRLLLSGDGADMHFDNVFYVVPPLQEKIRIAYFGSDLDEDPEQMRFYLSRAFDETPARKVEVTTIAANQVPNWEFDDVPRFVVITDKISEAQQKAVDQYLIRGGHALVVLKTEELVSQLGPWLGNLKLDGDASEKSSSSDYAMLGQIDFRHPLFVPFAGARYNDFTRIRFWKHRPVNIDEVENASIIARFEDQTPALWSTPRGKGTLYAMSSGWQRSDSQLALSTKFVPLLTRWLELAAGGRLAAQSYVVNQPVTLPEPKGDRFIRTPAGTQVTLTPEAKVFTQTTEPGVYTLVDNGQPYPFAVNLADAESDTEPLGIERLEQFDIATGAAPTQAEELERMRQLRDTELESRQKIWKWLIVAVLVLLGVETWLAARRSRQPIPVTGDFA